MFHVKHFRRRPVNVSRETSLRDRDAERDGTVGGGRLCGGDAVYGAPALYEASQLSLKFSAEAGAFPRDDLGDVFFCRQIKWKQFAVAVGDIDINHSMKTNSHVYSGICRTPALSGDYYSANILI